MTIIIELSYFRSNFFEGRAKLHSNAYLIFSIDLGIHARKVLLLACLRKEKEDEKRRNFKLEM